MADSKMVIHNLLDKVFFLQSKRWEHHYLDASTGKPGKGNVYVTKTDNPRGSLWAAWILRSTNAEGYYALESRRWPGHYLDASTGKPGKGNVYVTDGSRNAEWAQWRFKCIKENQYTLEARRWPRHYLDASTGKPGKGDVYVTSTEEPDHSDWTVWELVPDQDGISKVEAGDMQDVVVHNPITTAQIIIDARGKGLSVTDQMTYTHKEMRTHSHRFDVGVHCDFTYTAKQKVQATVFNAGFEGDYEYQFQVGGTVGYGYTFSCGDEDGNTRTLTFSAEPETRVRISAIVYEVTGQIPYTLYFKSGKIVHGYWRGTFQSNAKIVTSDLGDGEAA